MKLFGSSGGKWTKKEGQESAAPDMNVQDDWNIDELLTGTKQEPERYELPTVAPQRQEPIQRPVRIPEQQRPAERPVRIPEQQRPAERPMRMPEQQRRPEPVADERPRRMQGERPEANFIPGRENAWGKGILLIMSSFLLLLLTIYAVGAELTLWI